MNDEVFSTLLSRRERNVVDLLLQGKSNKQIALALGISERTVEFHLKNVYAKLHVASRVELIITLGQTTGKNSAVPVESTVALESENPDNGNQTARSRAARSLRNTVSLIKKEVAMTIKISSEELENYLRNHPVFLSLLVFLTAGLVTRYVIFDIGLYFWVSYILLGLLLGWGSIRFGLLAKQASSLRPLVIIALAALCPLIAASFDYLYVNTIVQYTGPVSISFAGITASAGWATSPEGYWFRSSHLSITSDMPWLIAIVYMLVLFAFSRAVGKQSKNNMANA